MPYEEEDTCISYEDLHKMKSWSQQVVCIHIHIRIQIHVIYIYIHIYKHTHTPVRTHLGHRCNRMWH